MGPQKMTVIVTGANGAIGFALCEYLLFEGYDVVAVTRQPLEMLTEFPTESGLLINAVIDDLTNESKVLHLLETLELPNDNRIGLVYGAAVFERISDFRDVSPDVWDRALNVNLKAAYVWNKWVSDYAISRGLRCSIVNISSQAWMTGGYGQVIAYASSKGALVTMSKSLARILAESKVRVNCVAPGFIDTDSMRGNLSDDEMQDFVSNVPMRRLGTTLEVARSIEFLLSENSSYITGVTLAVTGGQIMH